MKSIRVICIMAALFAVALSGCSDQTSGPSPLAASGPLPYVDDTILYALGGPIYASAVIDSYLVYDLSSDSLYREGNCNDVAIDYWTSTTCDQGFSVYSYRLHRYDPVT